jgi:hypothetical protein
MLVLQVHCAIVSLSTQGIHTPCPAGRVLVGRQVHSGGVDDVGGSSGVGGSAAAAAALGGRRAAAITTTTDLIFR